ncbi:peptidase C69 [Enterococcus gilvus]|uniref:C69 family dipeptidase n=1 Tax=Enterococcus gilvus TaxID=160453 RepID=UPI000DF61340|nr:C69 family dipeptidase [Enterococcus gilvus]AXG37402.1 peptidase C69 [Enterococcus gilvus]
MCTTVLVGKKASRTGSTMIARNCDTEAPIQPVKFVQVEENAVTSGTFHSVITHFSEAYPEQALGYQMIPFVEQETLGIFGEAGINSLNVAMSSTESIFGNPFVLAADPFTEEGLGEDALLTMVLPYITSAREGVEYVGKLIEKHGSHEGNGIIFSDKDDIWYMEIPCGHHWVAQRIPDDHCAVIANQSIIETVDFEDEANFMHSANIRTFVETHALNPEDGTFNFRQIFGTSNLQDRKYNTARVWYGQKILGEENASPTADDMPFTFQPAHRLTVDDVGRVLSSHFDETIYDPFSKGDEQAAHAFRPISMNRTAESHILEIRNNVDPEFAALFWLNSGPTAFNPYVPFYANSKDTSSLYNETSLTFESNQAYWRARLLAVLVERDYDKLAFLNFGYLTSAKELAHQLVLASDQEAENYTGEERKDFLTACNEKHAEKMNQLALDHIGALVEQGLDLSALTYDITKDI